MLSRFHLIPERHGQTDRIAISISRVSVLTRDKNAVYNITQTSKCGPNGQRDMWSPFFVPNDLDL